jgi:hypothetical protein
VGNRQVIVLPTDLYPLPDGTIRPTTDDNIYGEAREIARGAEEVGRALGRGLETSNDKGGANMFLSVTTASLCLGIEPWMLRNLYNRGLIPPAPRLGHSRIIKPDDLPVLRKAAISAGYLTEDNQ